MDEKEAANRAGMAYERSLKGAVRLVRAHEAARSDARIAVTDTAMLRLQVLADMMAPVIAEIPAEIDLFDTGLVPGQPPRYWVDMTAFVEMAQDLRAYRFWQDSRGGRALIAETPDPDAMADALTAYIAERLVAREQWLASPSPAPARPPLQMAPAPIPQPAPPASRPSASRPSSPWNAPHPQPSSPPPEPVYEPPLHHDAYHQPAPPQEAPYPQASRLERWRQAARAMASPQAAQHQPPHDQQAYPPAYQGGYEAHPAEQSWMDEQPYGAAEAPPAAPARVRGMPLLPALLLFAVGVAAGAAAVIAFALSAR